MHDDLIRLGLINDDDVVLDEAALALAMPDHPNVDPDRVLNVFQSIADRLAAIGGEARDAKSQARLLANVLGDEFGFVGDRTTYDDPANTDMIRVIERRRGLPVSLSILYVAAARRLGWTANMLDVPGHVLVLLGEEAVPVMIDPFRGGEAVDRDQLVVLLQTMDPGRIAAASHVATMSNRAILVRLLLNEATRAEAAGEGRRALTLYHRMTLVAPDSGHAWWERARLELIGGDVAGTRKSLSAMLEITREPELRAKVSSILASLQT
ncbi:MULTISPECIES: transglutaminase-like domain-containing protein [Sphingomonas]|jgi:regulator of sirC expression with transglutaminase-like and TPR domain|uniref:SirB1 family protein n=1 Tax=Sphingomonas TaxID=13687 RepID=UPI00104D1F3D|nr:MULTISPECIES: transglutaminase-like domain-containing protein [Sphingomonas]TCQ06290.1 regulator of sirC expression with transglutaminase-like and TPR domain [Sphingomonas sp. PP-CC-3A-396]